jgi:hypothetical protein
MNTLVVLCGKKMKIFTLLLYHYFCATSDPSKLEQHKKISNAVPSQLTELPMRHLPTGETEDLLSVRFEPKLKVVLLPCKFR